MDNLVLHGQQGRKPKVSIVIVTYKRGHLLNYALDALTVQTVDDFEVLLVVKPSGDATEHVIAKYRESLKIKVIIQEHGYVTDALNLGLKHVTGGIIILLGRVPTTELP
ncbi:MAG: glycosyltransferase family 2 protein [Candidatus Bathyarchaeota archaeon]|nr:glycosyltransferase family 2 protein [Candidatus Termiticorpusculum sp.]MCL1970350.1 glycosyltransferase family 2 protein [Candidatus Termiticorpusculum sp.]